MKKIAKNHPKRSIATVLTKRIAVVLSLIFILMLVVLVTTTTKNMYSLEEDKIELLAIENANITKNQMEKVLAKQKVVADVIREVEIDGAQDILKTLLSNIIKEDNSILNIYYVNTSDAGGEMGASLYATENQIKIVNSDDEIFNQTLVRQVIEDQKTMIADPYEKEIDNETYKVISLLQPVVNSQGKVEGVIGCDIDTEYLSNGEFISGGYDTFQNEIVCGHNTYIINSKDTSSIGKPYLEAAICKDPEDTLNKAKTAGNLVFIEKMKDGSSIYCSFVTFYVGDSKTPWLSGTSVDKSEIESQVKGQMILMVVIIVASLFLLLTFIYLNIRKRLQPLTKVVETAKELEAGKVKVTELINNGDEISEVIQSLNHAMEVIASYIRDIDRSMGEMAKGNFDVYPSQEFIGDFKGIENSITNFLANICKMLNQLDEVAFVVKQGADQVANGSLSLTEGATDQASAIELLVEDIEKLKQEVEKNDEFAKEAGINVRDAGEQLEISGSQMSEMMGAIHDISAHSREIEKIMEAIQDIAVQTNLLALNASIEAARAGESGRGFAIIATEVRELAAKSSEAAESSGNIIKKSISSVDNGIRIAKETMESMNTVRETAAMVVDSIEKICKASTQQKQEITSISCGAEQISNVIQTNTGVVEESMAVSEELASQADALQNLTSKFILNKLIMKEIKKGS